MPKEYLEELLKLSIKYGSDPDYALAGGGNTSWKSDDVMVVKASGIDPGYILAKTIDEEMTAWMAVHEGLLLGYIFLANHGVFIWGNGSEQIHQKHQHLFCILNDACHHAD